MDTDELQLPVAGRDYYRGYSWRTDEVGDSILVLHLREIVVFPPHEIQEPQTGGILLAYRAGC